MIWPAIVGTVLGLGIGLLWLALGPVARHRQRKSDEYQENVIKPRLQAAAWARQSAADPIHISDETARKAMQEWVELTQQAREDREP